MTLPCRIHPQTRTTHGAPGTAKHSSPPRRRHLLQDQRLSAHHSNLNQTKRCSVLRPNRQASSVVALSALNSNITTTIARSYLSFVWHVRPVPVVLAPCGAHASNAVPSLWLILTDYRCDVRHNSIRLCLCTTRPVFAFTTSTTDRSPPDTDSAFLVDTYYVIDPISSTSPSCYSYRVIFFADPSNINSSTLLPPPYTPIQPMSLGSTPIRPAFACSLFVD
jgi:hypothetical protein